MLLVDRLELFLEKHFSARLLENVIIITLYEFQLWFLLYVSTRWSRTEIVNFREDWLQQEKKKHRIFLTCR